MKNTGFSLIELMVALLISTILILGVTELFMRGFLADRDNTTLAEMQERGRLALDIIGQDARRAGFQGCTAASTITSYPGGGTLPDDAVTSTDENTLIFRYATPGSGCGTEPLAFEPAITYQNAQSGITRNGDPIIDNAQMNFTFLPTGNAATSSSLTVTIQVTDPRASGQTLNARAFSATFELRNKAL